MPTSFIERLGNRRSTTKTFDFNHYSPREELYRTSEGPDGIENSKMQPHQHSLQANLNVGSMDFALRTDRPPFIPHDPLKIIEHDQDKILKGYQTLAVTHVKGQVHFKNQTNRDNSMYNFKKDDIKELLRQQSKLTPTLGFSEPIPNNLKPAAEAKESKFGYGKHPSNMRRT